MKKISFWLGVCMTSLLWFGGAIGTVHAETHISDGNITEDAVWDEAHSPYIMDRESVNVEGGANLTIGQGVEVFGVELNNRYTGIRVHEGGTISIEGTKEKPVVIKNTSGIFVTDATARISHLDLTIGKNIYDYGIYLRNANLVVASSNIHGTYSGIRADQSKVDVEDTRFDYNLYGIESYSETPDDKVTVHNSSFVGNNNAAIINGGADIILDASDNWWGSVDGPRATSTNGYEGRVIAKPWLMSDPLATSTPCCSSVLFLPGIEGTRLFKQDVVIPGAVAIENRLWEPNRNADVKKLYLDSTGSSTDPAIYSGGPIDKAFGFMDVYGPFMKFMDKIASQGVMNSWKAFGYDWRKPIAEVVAGTEHRSTTTESLISVVEQLASTSKTGHVTLIAHSNGGLVAKYLVKTLTDLGKADLIDKVISVAVPFLGTPEAIPDLLHGDGQERLNGWLVSAANARGLGANMASAYSLLPSREYFTKLLMPTIAFASSTVEGVNSGDYPQRITAFADQTAFIADANKDRKKPTLADLITPLKGNVALLTAADALHSVLDPFMWPANIAHFAIAGWNNATIGNVSYWNDLQCHLSSTNPCLKHTNERVVFGDDTVVEPSAAHGSLNLISADMKEVSLDANKQVGHMSILNASSTQQQILDVIKTDNSRATSTIKLERGMSWGEPDYSKVPTLLELSTHSPVELHVYDQEGRHTGMIPIPTNTDEPIEEGSAAFFEEEILGSGFHIIGDFSDPETFVDLRDENSKKYTVVLKGTGLGTFTYDAERQQNGKVLDRFELAGIPVTPLTIATTTIVTNESEIPSSSNVDLKVTAMRIDLDGDGQTDVIATSSAAHIAGSVFFESLKKQIVALLGNSKRSQSLLKRLDHLEDLLEQGKLAKVRDVEKRLMKRVGHFKSSGLSSKDRDKIVDLIEVYISQFE